MLYSNFFVASLQNAAPDKVLLEADGKEILTNSLLEGSMAIALQQKGVKKGDRVILAVKPDIQFLKIFYANMMIGTIMSIIDPQMGRDNYKAKLLQFDPQVAFVDSRLVLLSVHRRAGETTALSGAAQSARFGTGYGFTAEGGLFRAKLRHLPACTFDSSCTAPLPSAGIVRQPAAFAQGTIGAPTIAVESRQ